MKLEQLKRGMRLSIYGKTATVLKSWSKRHPDAVQIQYTVGAQRTSVLRGDEANLVELNLNLQ